MSAIKGKYRNGQIILAQKADWPENTDVTVEPVAPVTTAGTREEEWTDTPEEIADWIQWYDSLEPLIMTAEEEKTWQDALQAQKEYDLSRHDERTGRIERLFE